MDSKKLNLFMNIIKYGLVAIGVIACILVIGGPNAEAPLEDQDSFRDGGQLGMAINYTLLIILAGVGVVLAFFVMQLITNTKKTVMSIIGLIVALVVYLIFWAMGTSDTNESLLLAEDVQVEQGTIATTTAGLYTVIVAVLVAVLTAVFGRWRTILSSFKK
jgi:hypothetical protein